MTHSNGPMPDIRPAAGRRGPPPPALAAFPLGHPHKLAHTVTRMQDDTVSNGETRSSFGYLIVVESEEVELSPCLRPLAQTARAVFPQAAFLYGRRAGVRSIVMPGTRLIKRMSPISVTSRRVGYLR